MMNTKGMLKNDKLEVTHPPFNLTILPPEKEPEKKDG
jgi:hypothetical protein